MIKFGPTPKEHRPIRRWETAPDNFVFFGQSQAMWHFSLIHPRLFACYKMASKIRCFFHGHEFSRLIELDKYVSNPKSRTHCLFCGKHILITDDINPGPLHADNLGTQT